MVTLKSTCTLHYLFISHQIMYGSKDEIANVSSVVDDVGMSRYHVFCSFGISTVNMWARNASGSISCHFKRKSV